MCFVFIIRIDSIHLPAAQQTPKQIPNMIDDRIIPETHIVSTIPSWLDFPAPMAVFHSNY